MFLHVVAVAAPLKQVIVFVCKLRYVPYAGVRGVCAVTAVSLLHYPVLLLIWAGCKVCRGT